jgi:hypothetical protein
MTKVTVDDVFRSKPSGLNDDVELCDESGQTLGHFVPEDLYNKLMYAWLKAQNTDEEVERLRKQTGGRPLAAIWKRLEAT